MFAYVLRSRVHYNYFDQIFNKGRGSKRNFREKFDRAKVIAIIFTQPIS